LHLLVIAIIPHTLCGQDPAVWTKTFSTFPHLSTKRKKKKVAKKEERKRLLLPASTLNQHSCYGITIGVKIVRKWQLSSSELIERSDSIDAREKAISY